MLFDYEDFIIPNVLETRHGSKMGQAPSFREERPTLDDKEGDSGTQTPVQQEDVQGFKRVESTRRIDNNSSLWFRLFRPSKSGVFHPKAKGSRLWSLIRVLSALALTWIASFECAFTHKGFEEMNVLRVLEIIFEILFVVDMFFSLNTGYVKVRTVLGNRNA